MSSQGRVIDNEMLRTAYGLHQAGRLAEAARAYGEVLHADPMQFDALFLLGLIHLQSGRPEDAERVFGQAVAANPESMDALSARATALQQLGRHAEALSCLDSLLAVKPASAIPWCNRGNSLLALERRADAIISYDRAIALKPDYAEAWHNRAVARLMLEDYPSAAADLEHALAIRPDYAEALEHLGVALAAMGRVEEALAKYDAALQVLPDRAELLCRRADSLLQLERFEEAVADYDRAIARTPDDSDAWHNRGSALLALGRREGALASYDRALALRGNDARAWKSRGLVLVLLQQHEEALVAFDAALARAPGDADAWEGRGTALFRLNRAEEALSSYGEALQRQPSRPYALFNRATALSQLKRYGGAANDCERLLAIAPDHPYARGLLLASRLHLCDWRDLDEQRVGIAAGLRAGHRVVAPFVHLAFSSSPAEQQKCAQIFAASDIAAASAPLFQGEQYRHDKIRIAYLSADFYAHATAFLMAGVFEHHDKARFETYAFSYGPDDNSAMRARLERAFDRFFDVSGESDRAIAAMLREHEIDIAVDLKGYTGSARPGILALRPAPVQVHYLGYPGTMGAEYIDYLVADRVVIPDEERAFYTEQIAYLPDTYQCNDRKRALPGRVPDRAELELPANGFVFCCFNANHKISPEIWAVWMRLLGDVTGSVLWLFAENDDAITNLRREARSRGVSEDRLIFAKRVNLEEHIARLALADLVLDTLPYGAHTTASDALWAGVPVLTTRGTTFAGRVAASLLAAAELPELITSSLTEYETRARALAADPAALAALRAKLARNRDTCPLFDTARITLQLEAAYAAMWQRHQRGEIPASFSLNPDCTPRFA